MKLFRHVRRTFDVLSAARGKSLCYYSAMIKHLVNIYSKYKQVMSRALSLGLDSLSLCTLFFTLYFKKEFLISQRFIPL